jgi:hypothetical protein
MTVGIAAVSQAGTADPHVVVAADRLMTVQQQSAIEHEHPEAKLTELAEEIDSINILAVVAGSVGLGEDLTSRVENAVLQRVANGTQMNIRLFAEIAGQFIS